MASATIRIVPQGEIARGTAEPPALKLPARNTFFPERAARLRTLSGRDPAAGGYLELIALVAEAQHAALLSQPETWRDALKLIAARLAPRVAAPTAGLVRGLASASERYLDNAAARLIEFDYPSLDARAVPFLGAALQVYRVHRATSAGEAAFRKPDVPNLCPVCGAPPVASTLRTDIPVPGSRYLHCALCCASWHLPRGQCAHCAARDKLVYFHIEGGDEVVKAEACDACRSYLKIVNQEKDPLADPVADDLATLSLDLLMDESGYERAGPNVFFIPGQT